MNTNVTDAEIDAAFELAATGGADRRKMLEQGVLKRLAGQHCGLTLTRIMQCLGLTAANGNVTRKGQAFCLAAFSDDKHGYGVDNVLPKGWTRTEDGKMAPPPGFAADAYDQASEARSHTTPN